MRLLCRLLLAFGLISTVAVPGGAAAVLPAGASATLPAAAPPPAALPASAQLAEGQPSIVESYEYPDADRILAERGIRLIRGDGRILLVPCGSQPNLIEVDSIVNFDIFCFLVKAAPSYLALELTDVYLIKGNSNTVDAKFTVDGETETIRLTQEYIPVGVGQHPDSTATLLELRAAA